MGQTQTNPYTEYQKEYTFVQQNQKDELLIRHKKTGKQYMLRKIIVKSQQELKQRLKLLNRRRKIKSEHLLNVVNFKPINNDRICGNIIYISLLIQYPFQSLSYQTMHRLSQSNLSAKIHSARSSPVYFQEHQLWSILYSCVLGLETLYMNDMAHESITKSMIFVDKDGVVKIGDPILLGVRTNYDRVIDQFQNEKRKNNDSQNSNHSGQQTPAKSSLIKINQAVDTSFIVSPELISLCKDHQYYFFDKQKSDVFVMGAIIIELGLLEDVVSVNSKENVFKTDLSEYFSQNGKLCEHYSSTFLSIVQSMVDLDPKKRPTLSEIVGKIEEFSIQENTNSEQNSFKKNQTEPSQSPQKYNSAFKGYSLNQKFDIKNSDLAGVGYGIKCLQSNAFKSSYIQPIAANSSVNPLLSSGGNQNIYSANQGLNYPQFPSFSISQSNQVQQNYKPNEVFYQSAVNSIFSKKLPVEIKYAQSPLIVPVSNRLNEQNIINRNYSTPFNNLNLTQSNEKKVIGKTIDKESIVQNKFTLFGQNNIEAHNLFQKVNENEYKNTNNVTERFSFHNFGRIQIPNTSNQTSLNTSTLPTPRFQNPFSNTQSTLKVNDVTKPSFTPTFHNFNSPNYGVSSSINLPSFANISNNNLNTDVQPDKSFTQNSYQGQNTFQKKIHESYDPKKQGFSISDDFKNVETYSIDHNRAPYFDNSSVGYTLPKYRPESAYSEVVQAKSQEKDKRSQSKLSTNSAKNINNISPTKQIPQAESIMHQENSPSNNVVAQNNLNSTQAINSITNITNQNLQTNSNTSTVKKEAHGSKKNSGKKYNFYKKELDEKLQKIDQPSPMVSTEIQQPSQTTYHQKVQSPFLGKQLKLSYSQNRVTQIEFEPQNHSIYVEERQQNGSLYRGYKLNNQRHGNGVLIFADSGFYQGQFNHDQMEGYGKLYYNEEDLAYEGQLKQNCFNGHGILYNNRPQELRGRFDFANLTHINNYWVRYDGYFKEDQKSGKCNIYFTNGQEFEGYCQNNTFEGKGRFKTIDDSYVEGIWKNNVLVEIQADSQSQQPNQ